MREVMVAAKSTGAMRYCDEAEMVGGTSGSGNHGRLLYKLTPDPDTNNAKGISTVGSDTHLSKIYLCRAEPGISHCPKKLLAQCASVVRRVDAWAAKHVWG